MPLTNVKITFHLLTIFNLGFLACDLYFLLFLKCYFSYILSDILLNNLQAT